MARLNNVDGVKDAIAKAIVRKQVGLEQGLKRAGLYLQMLSQHIVPVDYGNLKNTAFTRMKGQGTPKVVVQVGYTASYAVYVHENPDATHGMAFDIRHAAELAKHPRHGPYRHNRGPNQVYKFLEGPLRTHRKEILAIILAEVARA